MEAHASQILRLGLDDEIEMPPHMAHIRQQADDQKRKRLHNGQGVASIHLENGKTQSSMRKLC